MLYFLYKIVLYIYALYKYLRCDKLILLYNDCLEIEPMYIPRKFRNDRVHVMNEKEKNIYKKLALEKMKTEMEILTNRREHFRNNLDETDKGLKHFVGSQNIPEVLKKQVLLEWEKDCQKDVTRLEEVWENKIKGMKESFEKDKVSLERNSEFQTNEDSRENGINKKETNQSRREETRYRQTEQASYNQNQHRESSFNSTGYRPRNHNQNHDSSKKLLPPSLPASPKTTPKILNLSSYKFSRIQLSVLCHSTKFTSTRSGNILNYKNDLCSFTRKIKIKEIFHDKIYEDESIARNKSNKKFETKNKELSLIVNKIENLTPSLKNYNNNFRKEEQEALKSLKENNNLIFKTADKGGGWVIMDKNYYKDQLVMPHLLSNVYKEVSRDSDKKVFKNLLEHIKKHKDIFSKKEMDYLTNFKFSSSQFYCFPKIHKSEIIKNAVKLQNSEYVEIINPADLKGRPISGGPESPTQRLSNLVEILLKPLVPTLKTYVKDDWDFLRQLPEKLPFQGTMYSCDITSLYTSIPTELGIEAINYWLGKKRDLIAERFTNNFITESLKFILTNNNVLFDEHMYLQLLGTAMGTKCAPPYACLAIGHLEETKLFTQELTKYFNQDECNQIIQLLKRYMDDGFIFWPETLNFENFETSLNSMHPSIKFTFEKAEIIYENDKKIQVLNFLDIKVILHEDMTVETDIYYKPTNAHDYLPYDRAHPEHIKIIFLTTLQKG